MTPPELFIPSRALLGEGPAWDAVTQTLYWVDILQKRVYAGAKPVLLLDDLAGCVAPRASGGLILASGNSFLTTENGSKGVTVLAGLRTEPAGTRFNDGKCDPQGRFLAGTVDKKEKLSNGSLYILVSGGRPRKLLKGLRISNGIAWSPKGTIMYFIDTPTREVRAYDYDLDDGVISNPRVILRFADTFGLPDGMTTDTDGNLWVAHWGGGRVSQWKANGTLLGQFGLPAPNVTSCVFGGEKMDELFITTARTGLDLSTLRKFPLSGGVFRMPTNVTGMPTYAFAG